MAGAQVSSVEAFGALDGPTPVLVKPGTYDLRFDYYATAMMFGRAPKVILHFTIIEMGCEYFDAVQLPRYYNVTKLAERPRKYGRFKVGFRSNFLRDYARLFGVPSRLDRIPMTAFERVIIRGRIRTVTEGSDQRVIPDGLQYSVIEELVGVKR